MCRCIVLPEALFLSCYLFFCLFLLGVSPYQEPDGTIKAGPIVGIVAAGAVVLIAGVVVYYEHRLRQQRIRNRQIFAERVAETIDLRASRMSLSPAALTKEFQTIAAGLGSKDGSISKEALWEFVNTGKAGEMNKKDFDALFAAMDIDRNGTVNFLEFCSYMSICGEEYKQARQDLQEGAKWKDEAKMVAAARRISTKITASQRLAIEDPDTENPDTAVGEEDPPKK